jgi:DnaJ-class molecular chaperone
MATNLTFSAKESCENGDYEKYVQYAKNQYEITKSEEDYEEYQKSKKYLNLSQEIQQIIKLENKSSYEILNVKPDAPTAEIKRAFRAKATKYHPDRAPIKGAHDAFRIIQKAYFDINTEEKRAEYDQNIKRSSCAFRAADIYRSVQPNFYYSSANNGFMFSGSFNTGNVPFEFQYQNLSALYSALYSRRPQSRPRQVEQRSTIPVFMLILLFILLNVLI